MVIMFVMMVLVLILIVVVPIPRFMFSIFLIARQWRAPLDSCMCAIVCFEFWLVCILTAKQCNVQILLVLARDAWVRILPATENQFKSFWV